MVEGSTDNTLCVTIVSLGWSFCELKFQDLCTYFRRLIDNRSRLDSFFLWYNVITLFFFLEYSHSPLNNCLTMLFCWYSFSVIIMCSLMVKLFKSGNKHQVYVQNHLFIAFWISIPVNRPLSSAIQIHSINLQLLFKSVYDPN